MKNYYAILEVPVGCGVAEIAQAYRRLAQETGDNAAVVADLNEAYAVLTTPARRTDYDRAVWGETFTEVGFSPPATVDGGRAGETGAASAPSPPAPPPSTGGGSRCPMGAEAQCPVLLGRVEPADTYCPECGYGLAGLSGATGFEPSDAADEEGGIRLEEPDGRSHRLRPGLNTVGRESADVLLPDKTVSRRHARLEVDDDGTVTLEDLSSTNGTQVNGDVLAPHIARVLQAGDHVCFGSVVTALRLPAAVPTPGPSLHPAAEALRPAAVGVGSPDPLSSPGSSPSLPPTAAGAGGARAQVVEMREESGRTFALVPGVTTFGRRADNSVILQGDPYVSGSHAQIIADDAVFRLTDVGSTNGTLLNGRRLAINEPETLSEGDVILIGGTALRFEMLDVAEESLAEEVPTVEAEETDAPETDAPETDAPETRPENAPAEPRQRMAQEYDVPDDIADNGVPTRAAPLHETPTQHSPTELER